MRHERRITEKSGVKEQSELGCVGKEIYDCGIAKPLPIEWAGALCTRAYLII